MRIMGHRQYKVDSVTIGELNKIDSAIVKLVEEEEGGSSRNDDLDFRFKEKLTYIWCLLSLGALFI